MRILGVDLGQSQDYTAIALVTTEPGPAYYLRRLERPELKTGYPVIVRRLVQAMGRLANLEPEEDCELVVDATGVGRPVVDMMREAGLTPIPVVITGGENETYGDWAYRIPKRALISNAQVVFQQRLLKVATSISLAPVFVKELEAFKVKIDPVTAHDSYAAGREGQHDDLVLAVALALWRAQKHAEPPEPPKPPGPGTLEYNRKLTKEIWESVGEKIEREIAQREGIELWD